MSSENCSDELTIEVIGQLRDGPGRWQPRIGEEALSAVFRPNIPQGSRVIILQEAVNILSRCVPPSEPTGQETGLVIGYVQSGKTMSFTTVTALSHDNGYRIVIIIAGISQYLLGQSRNRLINDLRLNSTTEQRPWRHIPDPTLAKNSHFIIRDILEEWNDPNVPSEQCRTILITVMKNHRHLRNLTNVLRNVDLRNVPTLLIDDEGDQAGLNTRVRQRGLSTTYRRLLAVKDVIPHHSFLQYTATPQAPLLINIVDVLSPKFAEVITPGEDYIGGQAFFNIRQNLVRIIPADDIPTPDNQIEGPPQTLLQAMRFFFLGASVHLIRRERPPNRSMMVHPSRLTETHGRYFRWVLDAREGWMDILRHADSPAYADFIELFRRDYADLRATEQQIPSFDLIVPQLLRAMRITTVRTLNNRGEGSAPVNWSDNPYWILVGGQSLDRGFTVEGLTITYMPRGPGIGNADSIQQRARFFGYKRTYRGYCRVFLEQEVNDAFHSYIEHEEDIRSQMIHHRDANRSLSEWRREFFLARTLRPTRGNVIDIDYWRDDLRNKWVYPEGPHDAEEIIEVNRSIFDQFIGDIPLIEHDGLDRRNIDDKNMIARDIPLCFVHENLLTRIQVRRLEDSNTIALLLRHIQLHLAEHPNDTCSVILISRGRRIRRALEGDKIKELFQGRQYDSQGMTYPGDRQVKDEEGITVQLRYLDLGERDQPLIAENVPHAAVWVPASIARDILRQPQGG
jgi:hypothetical protein